MQSASGVAPSIACHPVRAVPKTEIDDGRYLVRFACTSEEIEAALKLRFEVFNLELGEGLDSSFRTGRDRDEFDATCHHLIVHEKTSGNVIGTYRLRTMEMAGSAAGFYSAAEFDLNRLPAEVLQQSVELGRACIAREHRDRRVLFLLWKALARYAVNERKRFLFGCCSLTSQEQAEGLQLFHQLIRDGYMHPTLLVPVSAEYECLVDNAETSWPIEVKVPRLFKTYLAIGARVCSPPAIDRRFKTIDYFVIFDIQRLGARARTLFFTGL